MTTDFKRDLLFRHEAELARWWADTESRGELDDDEFETQRRRNWLEAARHYDPQASLGEELVVRLHGVLANSGGLSFSIGDQLLKPLQDIVSDAADREIPLEITGVSRGSTVLHVQPVTRYQPPALEDEAVAVDSTGADPAMRKALQMVAAVEAADDLRGYPHLEGLDRLVQVLDKLDLSMALTWQALDGGVRTAGLSEAGKEYFRSLRQTTPRKVRRPVSGRVTELREAGWVKVKTGPAKNARAYDVQVPQEDLFSMRLALGDTVSFLTLEVEDRDRTGRVVARHRTFLRHLTSAEMLEFASDDDPSTVEEPPF